MRKFPLYRQHDSMQCGVTCLRMICAYWGKEYPAEYLDRLCGASREGVSLLGISETAAELGLKSVCARLTTGQLAEVELPAILHWNQNHFVVLYRISRKRGGKTVYHVADPGKGLRQYDGPSFEAGWIETRSRGEDKGIAMLAQPTPAFFSKRVPGKTERRSFTFLLGYLKRYRYYFGQVFLGLAVGSLLQLLFPFLTQAIVDLGIDHEDLGLIWLIQLPQQDQPDRPRLHPAVDPAARQHARQHLARLRLLHQAAAAAHGLLRHPADGRPDAAHGRP